MAFRSLVAVLTVLLVALLPAGAQAAAWSIEFEPETPVTGEAVSFHAERINPGNGGGDSLVWDFGDGGIGTGAEPEPHPYFAPGTYTVRLSTLESGTLTLEAERVVHVVAPPPPPNEQPNEQPPIEQSPNQPPSAAFTFAPFSPVAGEAVSFSGGSDSDGSVEAWFWDFGDGEASTEVAPSHAYAAAGIYPVSLTVMDDRGAFTSGAENVTVQPRADTAAAPPATATPPAARRLVAMRPFPIIRIAGFVLPRGAHIQTLSVRTPRGSTVRVRCRGRGCPIGSLARTAATRLVRLRRFERTLPARTVLEVFVRQRGKIGKYTRFTIRAGKAPARVDRCLVPGRARPVRCS